VFAAAAMVTGAVLVVRARSILFAVASLGIAGYGLALLFLFFGGPDLALTQLAVETLAVILFVLVLRRLPPLRSLSSPTKRTRDAVVAVAGGAVMTGIVLATAATYHPAPLRTYFAEASVPLAHGRNVVNVILVDFRALDTLGEITVLAVAALGVLALMRLRAGSAGEDRP
jgi:multicomponent Na+:H+ antiporter subunit A